jgi:acetyl/propionyl-CoA carboxylase alpha subunit
MIPDWMVGATHPFDSVLVANRGEIAVRVLRAASEAGLRGVAVYSDPDEGALHVEVADEAVYLPGETLGETYLNSEAIIQAAKDSGAQAIHPGYGFLSERADFARMVAAAGLVWIGPPTESIETMGDKISARRRMIDSGVPVIPGEELAISEDADHLGTLAAAAARVGYPLLIKASAGGGGKGMRAVHEPRMLRTEYEAAAREASAAFGDGTVYVERLLTGARHVEIQVLCDSYGNAIHLNERDCSLQRRHQKVLEEAPSPAVTPLIRAAMGETAVQAAQSVDYEGVGTVEFLLSSRGEFFFLEMNTRLQVEHPITELTTGIDLVQKQFEVAAGMKLTIQQDEVGLFGHAIEARIYAEDASKGFLPAIGKLAMWRPPSTPGVRFDSGFREGDEVTVDFDPMLAKLIVHAPSRKAALRRLDTALSDFVALGVTTNVGFLRQVAAEPAFTNGEVTTDYLDSTSLSTFSEPKPENAILVAIAAAASRFGLDRTAGSASVTDFDDHTGHAGDPFRTLKRSFP